MQAVAVAVPDAESPVVDGAPRPWRSRHPLLAQILRYMVVGGASTALNAVLFYLMRTWWEPVPASLVSLAMSTAVSTEANRRFTFGAINARRWRIHLQSAGTVAFYACYSVVVLVVLHVLVAAPTPLHETLAIAGASVLGGASRFLLLRYWVFVPVSTLSIRTWAGTVEAIARIPHRTLRRSVLAVLAGMSLLLSSAGACGGDDDDDAGGVPGVSQQDEDD